MSSIKHEVEVLHDLESAKFITSAMRDISALQLKKTKDRFERSTRFFKELQNLYHLIGQVAQREGVKNDTLQRKGPKLYVAFTSNKHFYGSLNNDVMDEFVKKTGTEDECLIIGETGQIYWQKYGKKRAQLTTLTFKEDSPSSREIQVFLSRTVHYGQVFIFYPSYVTVFKQEVAMLDITYRYTPEETTLDDSLQYILEPEIVDMFFFFETQVRYILFERIILEIELARIAARLMKMDTAYENANVLIKKQGLELRRANTSISSIRLLETFTGFVQWNKTQKHLK